MKKTKLLAVTLIIITTFSLVTFMSEAITWTSDKELTYHEYVDVTPSVAQASDGKIWIVWASDRMGLPGENWDIFYNTTYDGVTWYPMAPNQPLIGGAYSDDVDPSIMRGNDGTLWLVWDSNMGGNYDIFYKTSSNNGTTWSTEQQLTLSADDDLRPNVSQAYDGTIWVVWQRATYYGAEIWYRTYSPTLHQWAAEKRLTNDSTISEYPSVGQSADGRVWIVWDADIGGNWDLYAQTTSDNGATWSARMQLTTSKDMDVDPMILRTIYGKLWIVWSSKKSAGTAYLDLFYIISSDNGATWGSPVTLTTDQYDDAFPSIIQARDRKFWIVWASNRVGQPGNGNLEIFYKTTIPLMGDVNEDGIVDAIDLALISKAYGTQKGNPLYSPASDLNNDNIVDLWDLTLLAINYGKTG